MVSCVCVPVPNSLSLNPNRFLHLLHVSVSLFYHPVTLFPSLHVPVPLCVSHMCTHQWPYHSPAHFQGPESRSHVNSPLGLCPGLCLVLPLAPFQIPSSQHLQARPYIYIGHPEVQICKETGCFNQRTNSDTPGKSNSEKWTKKEKKKKKKEVP